VPATLHQVFAAATSVCDVILHAPTLLLMLSLLLLLLLLSCRSACHFMSECPTVCQLLAAAICVHPWLCFSAAHTALTARQAFQLLQMLSYGVRDVRTEVLD
jgi:hypothetical protein